MTGNSGKQITVFSGKSMKYFSYQPKIHLFFLNETVEIITKK
jgi:hypothetical protein